jgi:hypothetical protein
MPAAAYLEEPATQALLQAAGGASIMLLHAGGTADTRLSPVELCAVHAAVASNPGRPVFVLAESHPLGCGG